MGRQLGDGWMSLEEWLAGWNELLDGWGCDPMDWTLNGWWMIK
jgi:hypothetical protein